MHLTLIISTHGGWLGILACAGETLRVALAGAISWKIYSRVDKVVEVDQGGRRSSVQTSEVAGNGVRRMVGGLKREDGSV
jgi:hypothetical protein